MKLKQNINYNFLLIISSIFSSCVSNFEYQKIKIDAKNKTLEILSEDFVFDSIIIENNDKTFFNSYLLNKKLGVNVLNLNDSLKKNYVIIKSNYHEMCDEKNNNGMKVLDIVIRNKNYFGSKKIQNRENIQKFNMCYFPCDNKIIVLEAIGRH